ncbi:hypothetical protein PVAND_011738 [Polypedilum vanderplanki]|uniref:Amine oxidase domain-containing protein n=1 Tax=Polypedilum vanderplanki TaxID=319348 RepID=A0A9J6CJK2_POLVA|nr:hypothetical protein PVAND_011738 [Polypedilum vanderplanki]
MNAKDEATTANTQNHYKVIIIGAGVAGLTAANHLCSNGIKNFKILEARNRCGGRIVCIDIGNQKIELGATWVHGILGNPIFEFAMQHNLLDVLHATPQNRKVIALAENGSTVPFEMLQEIYEAYLIFLRRCEEYFLCTYVPPDDCFSVGAHIKLEIDLYLKSIENTEEKRLREMIFNCLLKRETCITGCHSMDEIDLLELGSYTELQGGNIILENGYSSILGPLKSGLPPDSILLNCPVKTIKWKRKKAPVTSPGGLNEIPEEEDEDGNDSDRTITDEPKSITYDGRVQIICNTNEIFYADHVICTVPLGVLKTNINLFDPPLPEYKKESIDRLLFGTVNKIFLEYERPFLSQDISEIMLLWEDDLLPNQEPTEEQIKEFWYKKIYSFSKINDTLILGWISGKEAEYMETLDSDIVAKKCTELLKKFLNDPYIPNPKRCVKTSWHGQPYSKGSYTSIAVGASQEDIENIVQPLYSNPHQSKPSILFAGEHCHSNFYSTVHGAFLTGRNAAQIIYRPDSPQEIVIENDTSDLSSWIQGISLE